MDILDKMQQTSLSLPFLFLFNPFHTPFNTQ